MKQLFTFILLVGALFLLACAPYSADLGSENYLEPSYITEEIDHSNPSGMLTFDVQEKTPTLYDEWQEYNKQRLAIDKWDAFVSDEEHELSLDADISDDWLDCDRDIFVMVEIENRGNVYEEDVLVTVTNNKLDITSTKTIDIDNGHKKHVRFPFDLSNDIPRGDYEFDVEVSFDEDEDEESDSVDFFVANCRE